MGKLIPSRIRNQGIDLYHQGLVSIKEEKEAIIVAQVADQQLDYALEDYLISCSCVFFQKKDYCEHLAAFEYYLKNSSEGKSAFKRLTQDTSDRQESAQNTSFGSLFLDGLTFNEDDQTCYRLSATGAKSPFSSDFWWTLKMSRLPDERAYIVRDIKVLLTSIQKESYYQIGKNYYEPLSIRKFDEASQELIHFLLRLLPDSKQADTSFWFPNQGRHLNLSSGFFEEGVRLLSDLHAFSFEGDNQTYHYLTFKELEAADACYRFKVLVHRQSIELIIQEKPLDYGVGNYYLRYQNTFYHLSDQQRKLVVALKSLPLDLDLAKHVHFGFEDQAKLASHLLDFKTIGQVEAPSSFDIRDFEAEFAFDLLENGRISLVMAFHYGDIRVASQLEKDNLPFSSHFKKEERLKKLQAYYGFSTGFQAYHAPLQTSEWYDFFHVALPAFRKNGKVHLSERLEAMYVQESPQMTITTDGSLLDISFDFSQLDQADINQAVEALLTQQPYFVNQTGKVVVFDDETQKVSQVLQELRAKKVTNGHLQLQRLAAFQLSESLSDQANVTFSEDFSKLSWHLRHPEDFAISPLSVNAHLRDYQLTGVKWLSMLDSYGFGGILADDMGLGKTLQTLAFLNSKLTKQSRVLILSPSSLIYNWQDECQKFVPNLDVAVAYGSKSIRDSIIAEDHQLIITSYASFRQDFDLYSKKAFDYLILDEAQVMKNTETKIAHRLREFDAKNCFALSGTPIENKLLEIWSIFQIILPGLLPNKKAFTKMNPKDVARYIKPFIMRRRKEDVLPELPDLSEITYHSELADEQKAIYLAQLQQIQSRVQASSIADINRQKIEILSGITRLRQICDTPRLFMTYTGDSGKLTALRELLTQVKENGHRALIFSQFRGMLDIVEKELTNLGLSSYKLTGSTPANQRQEMTKAFNKGSKDTFLISLKAGGVGLNLTGANTVILIDLWWNPAVEMQAISRAHRLGQKETVTVYRLVTKGTIEEKILQLQADKKHLVTTVLDGNETRASLTVDDIKEILGIS